MSSILTTAFTPNSLDLNRRSGKAMSRSDIQKLFTTPPLKAVVVREKAILFSAEQLSEDAWIPKSQIIEPELEEITVGWVGEIMIPDWLAKKLDLA